MKKLAFCFLIYDIINHDELWNIFFKNVDINKYTIYIHYKFKKPLKYFEHYKLKNCIETKYEDQTIPLAYNILFKEAFKDENNYKFIILSGSCIPFKSFDFIYCKLTQDHYGYLNVCPQVQCFPNCDSLTSVIDKKFISKSSNWFILNRKLVESLCFDKDDFLKKHYNKVYAPAEYFYYTFIKILNLEDEIITTPNVANDASTFANWAGMDYKYVSLGGLKNYNSITQDEIQYLMYSKCLFGRKFTSQCAHLFSNNKDYIEYISS